MTGLSGCEGKDIVLEKFKEQLEQHGLKIDSTDSEEYHYIAVGGQSLKISLENVRRNFERDNDETHITDLVNSILAYSVELPTWEKAKNNIFISFYPNDFDFGDILHEKITGEFSKIYVYSGNDKLTWISQDDLNSWNITVSELDKQADLNASLLLEQTDITFDTIEGRKLGMINLDHASLKGALLFASNMKDKISKDIGFPFYAVIPVRDFCYIFSDKDFDFFSQRLGQTVVQEYKKSGYPITTEILKFSDKGVEAVGKYPVDK